MKTTFSIVITTYNRLLFLKQAVASALSQTLPCEIIVIDDCSQDGTQEYVQHLENRVVYHRNSTSQGWGKCVNIGVELAGGEWIKFLDDDDYLAPHCIEEMSRAIAAFPESVILSCQAIRVNETRTELNITPQVGSGEAVRVLQEDIHYQMLFDRLPFGTTVQVAAKKVAFLNSGGWNSQLADSGFEAIDSWVRIAEYGDGIFVNQPLGYRRLWWGNISQQRSIQERLNANITLKHNIYSLVHEKYQAKLPEDRECQEFLELYWGMVGLKHGTLNEAWHVAQPSLFSFKAWNRLLQVIYMKKFRHRIDSASLNRLEQIAIEYYNLSVCSELSESEIERIEEILKEAESEPCLSLLLDEVDCLVLKQLNFLEEDGDYYQQQSAKIRKFIEETIVPESSVLLNCWKNTAWEIREFPI
ncbi:glycosyltransferase family 2 protein [Lusitaniella coriacea LEGE 07157]|uniref:Glycosyltransferase family 2 protein n=1 Tax=Lusitaniella coriacea LEGE 07157 TaxID=945747 RepID=A0A8J7AXG5_9CYAN|nr:glycosyltransferase family 2 protein [Lusitaniella coriacea]MBE9114464.1 glycosyltransferase family 2 protein [Lusitaniella coriacea LEGE 07157]